MKESKRVLARAVARELTVTECEQVEGAWYYSYSPTTSDKGGAWPVQDDRNMTDIEE